jgi:acetyl-CoA C-acetyltransferase
MDAVILSAVRTPIGKFLGGLSELPAPRLGAVAVHIALGRAGLKPEHVDEVVMGHVVQAGCGQNPARQAALYAGFPDTIAAYTVNKVCGSGLKAVMLAAQSIKAGDADVVVAGGMESMSNAPFLLPGARKGYKYGDVTAVDSLVRDGLWCAFEDCSMGDSAEHIAAKCGVTRSEQDRFAAQSNRRAAATRASAPTQRPRAWRS